MTPDEQETAAELAGKALRANSTPGDFDGLHRFCSARRVERWVEEDRAKDELIRTLVGDYVFVTDLHVALVDHSKTVVRALSPDQAALLRTILNGGEQ